MPPESGRSRTQISSLSASAATQFQLMLTPLAPFEVRHDLFCIAMSEKPEGLMRPSDSSRITPSLLMLTTPRLVYAYTYSRCTHAHIGFVITIEGSTGSSTQSYSSPTDPPEPERRKRPSLQKNHRQSRVATTL